MEGTEAGQKLMSPNAMQIFTKKITIVEQWEEISKLGVYHKND